MLQPGQIVAEQYEIERVLGTGSFSTVYLAYDAHFPGGRRVAIKEFSAEAFSLQDQEWARDTIAQEARLRGNLPSHSALANVLAYFDAGQRAYLVMEYVEGETLEEVWRRQPALRFSEAQVLDWAGQLCDVLSFLHNQTLPIIYRDLKPANIMLRPDGQLVLIDFGIARLHKPHSDGDTINMGTAGYAAPEQYQNQQSDARTDIYALGVILHQLLTGMNPAQHVLNLPAPREVNPALSSRVAAAIEQATALHPEQRFRSARAFRNALTASLPESSTASAPPVRSYHRLVLGSALLLLLLGSLALLLIRRGVGSDGPAVASGAETGAVSIIAPQVTASETATPEETTTPVTVAAVRSERTRQEVVPPAKTVAVTGTPLTSTATALPTEQPTTTPAPTALPQLWTGTDQKSMNLVPAGDFIMGSTRQGVENAIALCRASGEGGCAFDQFSNEMPQRTVYLDAYYIDNTEVTNAEYARCVQANGCSAPVARQGEYQPDTYYANPTYANYPVVHVSWYDARAYCRWAGKTLPSEAQWEKAARGTDGRLFPWGNEWDCYRANTEECGGDRIQPVGGYRDGSSPYGVLNMAGNVWEWIEDAFDADYYSRAPDRNPPAATSGAERVLRGGGYSSYRHYARTTNRGLEPAGTASSYRGFRCVLPTGELTP